ncbi:MAG TPA: ABC transporter ATP-binding protein, partial [Magnetovibrio sp.]
MNDTPLLQVQSLNTHYGQSHILHGVDFNLSAGQSLALLGRNGMGKTTTIRSLFGLTPPTSGSIKLRGIERAGSPPHVIAQDGMALVPEGRGIFPSLSVEENLLMAARPGVGGKSDWTLERAYAAFPRLKERRQNAGDALSGGEQQMLAIARAMLTNPDVLVLDEATEGLAPLIREELWDHIRSIAGGDIAIIVVDKDLQALMKTCSHALILAKGQ